MPNKPIKNREPTTIPRQGDHNVSLIRGIRCNADGHCSCLGPVCAKTFRPFNHHGMTAYCFIKAQLIPPASIVLGLMKYSHEQGLRADWPDPRRLSCIGCSVLYLLRRGCYFEKYCDLLCQNCQFQQQKLSSTKACRPFAELLLLKLSILTQKITIFSKTTPSPQKPKIGIRRNM